MKTHSRFLAIYFLLAMLVVLALAGCGVHSVRAEYQHVSHPFAGPPFGPTHEEDALDVLNTVVKTCTDGGFCVDHVLGYKLADGGFYGPRLTYEFRASIALWEK